MDRLVSHRQTKGAATVMLITYHHRATFLLYQNQSVQHYALLAASTRNPDMAIRRVSANSC
jgi:hypothetical protein